MKILSNKKIKFLFYKILTVITLYSLLSIFFISKNIDNKLICFLVCTIIMTIIILVLCYRYFIEQNAIYENAITIITEYISGNTDIRIECDEEGELYRLFHEINSLASILNATANKERSSKEFLKNMISDISHQLKTPLAALNIYNGLIQEEVKNLPEINDFVTLSEKELDRIESLVQNMLKIAKLDAGTLIFNKTSENVTNMIEELSLYFTYRANDEKKEFKLTGDNDIFLVCDKLWIMEAIKNIVKNAFDHTKSGDCISISWKKSASIIQIIIKDNGCGIHPEDIYHVFKRFYRSRFSKDTQGIGLGLPLAKAMIEEHNGSIELDSELGIGTTFTINFPTQI